MASQAAASGQTQVGCRPWRRRPLLWTTCQPEVKVVPRRAEDAGVGESEKEKERGRQSVVVEDDFFFFLFWQEEGAQKWQRPKRGLKKVNAAPPCNPPQPSHPLPCSDGGGV